MENIKLRPAYKNQFVTQNTTNFNAMREKKTSPLRKNDTEKKGDPEKKEATLN